jgi:hypothetical protein
MNRNSKITLAVILGLMAVLVLMCIAGAAIAVIGGRAYMKQAVRNDPAEAALAAHAMIDYDLPPGYFEASLVKIGLTRLVAIQNETPTTDGTSKPSIMIAQTFVDSTGGINDESYQQIMQMTQRMMGRGEFTLELVDTKDITIGSQEVTLFISEGVLRDGSGFRQISSEYFEGKAGLVMILITGAMDGWDQKAVDLFIGSLR